MEAGLSDHLGQPLFNLVQRGGYPHAGEALARRREDKEMNQCSQGLDNSLALAPILGGIFTLLSPWLAHFLPPHLESGNTMG